MKEEWTNIKSYEGKYIISNTGKVVSLNYNNTGKPYEEVKELNNTMKQMSTQTIERSKYYSRMDYYNSLKEENE